MGTAPGVVVGHRTERWGPGQMLRATTAALEKFGASSNKMTAIEEFETGLPGVFGAELQIVDELAIPSVEGINKLPTENFEKTDSDGMSAWCDYCCIRDGGCSGKSLIPAGKPVIILSSKGVICCASCLKKYRGSDVKLEDIPSQTSR